MSESRWKPKYYLFISDTHIGITHKNSFTSMLGDIAQKINLHDGELEAIILAGDIGETLSDVKKALGLIREIFPETILLGTVGNHDLSPHLDSINVEEKYYSLMPELFLEYGGIFMDSSPFWTHGRSAIVGNVGWYDYEARNHSHSVFPPEYWQSQKFKTRFQPDCFIEWSKTDIEFAKELRDAIIKTVVDLEQNTDIDSIIVVNHHPQFYEEIRHGRDHYFRNRHNDLNDVYFYNPSLGKELQKFPKVKLAVSGHIHVHTKTTVDKHDGSQMLVYTVGSDYRKPGYLLVNVENNNETISSHEEIEIIF